MKGKAADVERVADRAVGGDAAAGKGKRRGGRLQGLLGGLLRRLRRR